MLFVDRRLDPHWPQAKPRARERKDDKLARALTAHAIRYATQDVLSEWVFDNPNFPAATPPPRGSSGLKFGLQAAVRSAGRVKQIADRWVGWLRLETTEANKAADD